MSLIKWSPFMEPFSDMDKFFDGFRHGAMTSYSPAMDIYEQDDHLIVEAGLAGIDPKNVEVIVENDILTIQGKTEKKSEVDEKNYYRREMRSGSFYRTVALPAHVDGSKAKAEFDDGVLKVSVPKLKSSEAKKIEVKVNKSK